MHLTYVWDFSNFATKHIVISEPVDTHLTQCTIPVLNASALTDYNRTTCISPFEKDRRLINLAFYVHLLTPRDPITLTVATNIDCHEPFTLVAGMKSEFNCTYLDYDRFTQCTFLFKTALDYGLNACHFSCLCHGHCDVILLRHNFLPWRNSNPESYKTCNVHIAPEPW